MASFIDARRFRCFAAIGAKGFFSDRMTSAGVHVISLEAGFGNASSLQTFYLTQLIAKIQPTIVHLNAVVDSGVLAMLLCSEIPFVSHYRVCDAGPYRKQLGLATRVIAVSEFAKPDALQLDIDPRGVEVIYDEADTAWFSPTLISRADARRRLSIGDHAFVVSMIARFVPRKRHDVLLRAITQARGCIPGLQLLLIGEGLGEGSTLNKVRDFIEVNDLSQSAQILPFVDDLRDVHAASDVLVLCSQREALGRCVVEAMSMGSPLSYLISVVLLKLFAIAKQGLSSRRGDRSRSQTCWPNSIAIRSSVRRSVITLEPLP